MAGPGGDQTTARQACHHPRNRLDGQAEIIGHVLPAHRQLDLDASSSLAMNREQEADDPFLRSLAAKEQHLVLGGRHFVAEDCEELRPQRWRFVDHHKEAAASETPNLNLGDRLRRKEIAVLEGHPQDVTGLNETHDGATAVGHDPVNAHHAFQHVENVPGLVTLPEERRSSRQDLSRLALEEVFEGEGLLEGGSEGNGWTTRCGDRSLAIHGAALWLVYRGHLSRVKSQTYHRLL